MSKIFRLFLILAFAGTFTQVAGQGQGNSPYSVLGIGEEIDETVAAQDMMGGVGVSFTNTFYINQLNPALLVKNRTINGSKYVAFCIGFKGKYNTLTQGTSQQLDFGLNLNNLTMAFPLTPKWAISVNLRPYTLAQQKNVVSNVFTGTNINNNFTYDTQGSISRVAVTNSFEIAKGLFVGLETQFNFGNILKDTTSSIANSLQLYRNSSRINLNGTSFKSGLAYQLKLNKKWNLNLGGFYQFNSTLKGEELRTFSVLADTQNGASYVKAPDTLSLTKISTGTPSKFKVGVSLESSFHWVFAVDYGITNWGGVTQYDKAAKNVFVDAKELNVGIEWLPNSTSTKYINQVFYRAGFKSTQTPYFIKNTQITDNSFSLGMSLPMGFRNPSYVDLGVAIGTRGINANGLIKENYTRISASFSLLSSWFAKQRID